jgi:Holin of 3TMs, for gene-transfer release
MAAAVLGALGGDKLLSGVSSVINAIRGKDPEAAAALDKAVVDHNAEFRLAGIELEKQQLQANVQLNDIAGQNVRADAQNGDKFTARARPAVIWVGLGILVWNYCVVPCAFLHWGLKPAELPSLFWEAWIILCTGVVFTRTADKILGGAGGSMQLPFGVKVESKGDQ